MYIVAIAWLYVAILMAVAEATHTTGTLLGGIITFVMYGLLPLALVMYVMGAPVRRRTIKAKERSELETAQIASGSSPDADGETATDAITSVRKEP
ncbi:MAG: hypothetical protein CVU24_17145 [Betaproteobacteria bacterium HGW-Betaproteobacteria-18]|nr:MAG: hypothetical protein CVU24_17145 [Betaproteobacteria bacterium HGW-Betaproteobacteria-18]